MGTKTLPPLPVAGSFHTKLRETPHSSKDSEATSWRGNEVRRTQMSSHRGTVVQGSSTLKPSFRDGSDAVECSVDGCVEEVPRKDSRFRLDLACSCRKDEVCISQTTSKGHLL